MQKLCPSCNTLQESIGFDLSEKEMHNLKQIGLSENLCKSCYQAELTTRLEASKSALIPLNKEKELTQAAYYTAYELWKAEAELYKALDYNINIRKHAIKMKEAKIRVVAKPDKEVNVELLCQQILASLSKEQQAAVLAAYQATQPCGDSLL